MRSSLKEVCLGRRSLRTDGENGLYVVEGPKQDGQRRLLFKGVPDFEDVCSSQVLYGSGKGRKRNILLEVVLKLQV